MKVVIFGATGMVGEGVLRECLEDPQVQSVLVVGRSSVRLTDPKILEILHDDFLDFKPIQSQLAGYDAFSSASAFRRRERVRTTTAASPTT